MDAAIEFKLADQGLSLRTELLLTVTGCVIEQLSFSENVVSVSYEIGTIEIEYDIPAVVESPDCGTSSTWSVTLLSIDSSLATEQA